MSLPQSQRKTQAILFDLMGVLLFRRDDYVPDKMVDAIDEQIGQVTNDVRFREETLLRYGLNGANFENVLARIANKYVAFPPLWELLPALKKQYKLGIINNGTYLTFPLLNSRFGLERNFDLFLSSAREGFCKPDARIYLRACQQLGFVPAKCLFMDDVEKNIIGAKKIGMQTIHWAERISGFLAFQEWLMSEAE